MDFPTELPISDTWRYAIFDLLQSINEQLFIRLKNELKNALEVNDTISFALGDKYFSNCLENKPDCFLCIPKDCQYLDLIGDITKEPLLTIIEDYKDLILQNAGNGHFDMPDEIVAGIYR